MTILDANQLLAGFQPPIDVFKSATTPEAIALPHSLFYSPGSPGAAAAPTPGINGAALTSYAGQIPWANPIGGNLGYLGRVAATCSQVGTLIIGDRLWHNSGITPTTTTEQAITTPTLPARDRNGATLGDGIMAAVEVSGATGNASAITNMTLRYTNSAGTANRTGTIPSTRPGGGFPATANAGSFLVFDLAAGDTGIRSIEGITLGTSLVSGTVHLVLFRVLARIPVLLANSGDVFDAQRLGMPRVFNDSVPFLYFIPSAASAFTVQADITWAHG